MTRSRSAPSAWLDAPWDRRWPQIHAELADWTGRLVRPDNHGTWPRYDRRSCTGWGCKAMAFADMACHLLERVGVAVGAPRATAWLCARQQRWFLHGQRTARRMLVR
ncbi:MAG: hypothetical protein WCZ18_07930 [Ottowia sp.]|nr:hypothetical protein [Ottowia sp.]